MGKYICKALPTEKCNEDFAPDADLREGVEVDGFVLIGFKDGKALFETIMGISMDKISKWIRNQSKGGKLIRAACAIAEGEIRAKEMLEEDEDQGVTLSFPSVPLDVKTIRKILGQE